MSQKKIDQVQVFNVFSVLVGDVEKTALALDLDPNVIRKLANEHGWAEKIARISLLSKSGNPGDWERAQNRALNFVQAHQLRRVIDLQLAHVNEKTLEDVMRITDLRTGETRYSAQIIRDLAGAMQKVHEMTYNAVGDSVKERTQDKPNQDPVTQAGLHGAMISALNRTGTGIDPAKTLADEAAAVIDGLKSAKPHEVVEVPDARISN